MTKKDYIKFAKLVKGLVPKSNANTSSTLMMVELVNGLVEIFKENPRFDEQRFREACEWREKIPLQTIIG